MLDKANAYFNGTLSGDKWNEYNGADKIKAIKESQKLIAMLPISGVPDDIIGTAIIEQAFCILSMPESVKNRIELQAQGVSSIKAGNASESYKDSESHSELDGFCLCPKVKAMLTAYVHSNVVKSGSIGRSRYPKRCF